MVVLVPAARLSQWEISLAVFQGLQPYVTAELVSYVPRQECLLIYGAQAQQRNVSLLRLQEPIQ